MGIDFAIGRARDAIMLDQRSQSFCSSNNRWFSNQLPDQTYLTMNRVEAFDGRTTPQGLAPAGLSPGFANRGGNLLLSTNSPTDAFDDLTGPTMDNGYGICQSPGLDSVYSNRTNMGTPNSFTTDCPIDSPRERLLSTSSSTYTYSPYNVHEERTCTPTLQRQASLDMVEQYFNNSPCVTACTDENGLLDSSSQGFTTAINSNTASAEPQSIFRFDDYFVNPVEDVLAIPGIFTLEGSPQTDSTQTSNSAEDNTATTSCNSNSTPVYVDSNANNMQVNSENCHANPLLPRQMSLFSEIIKETMEPNSQEAAMVSDFVNSFGDNTQFQTINIQILAPDSQHSPEPQCLPQETNIPVPQNTLVTPIKFQSEEDVSSARRERNNAACRASRKRRKDKKSEMENSVGKLEDENRALQQQIEHLELECKRFKADIFARMGNPSR